jgi:FlaA1/EpsC-like NDP-sugar epimerase
VTDEALVRSTMEAHRPDLVFHAAAHKHVPLMEENPCEAIKNNVRGTRVMAAAAEEAGVDRFILISTDKAANPTSIMGASKRVAELVVQAQAAGSGTSYAIVRFGNVLGSNGSVVPRFLEQIQRGGPVTVTHPDVRRFFMLIPEAVQLVLHAAAEARSGATYVLDMGEQIRVADMARNLIRLAGKIPDEDIQIVFTGLRPGEKLAEELIGGGEHIAPSNVPKVSVVTRNMRVPDTFVPDVASLEAAAALGDVAQTTARLRTLAAMSEPTAIAVEDAAANVRPARSIAKPKRVAAAPTVDAQACPRCGQWAHRSRARRFDQHLRKRLTNRRLYRCSHCHWRGWLVPADLAGIQPAVAAVDVIDLKSLDQPAPARESRPGFSPKDLS